jgi:hypothetical protein
MASQYQVLDEVTRQYRRFRAQGTQIKVRLNPPPDDSNIDPITHFETCFNALFEYALRHVSDGDMVGLTIHNEGTENQQKDKPIGFSFRRRYQLSTDVIWKLFEKVTQSNARFNALDPLVVTVHAVKMPLESGRAVKTEGRQLDALAHLKHSIVRVNADTNCLAHALIIAIARLENNPNYKA